MPIQRAYVLRCPECPDSIVLRRQNPLEIIPGLPHRPMDIWPLRYWCENCDHVSSYQVEDFHLEGVETLAQNPYTETLWAIEFVCVLEGFERRFSIYAKRMPASGEIERIMFSSGACDDSERPAKFVKAYQFSLD